MNWLITSGGTKVKIDDVRHIGNMSSGRFGAQLAEAALRAGHHVTFLHAAHSERPDRGYFDLNDPASMDAVCAAFGDFAYKNLLTANFVPRKFTDFDDYARKLEECLRRDQPDVTILCAAVSDYGLAEGAATEGKISSDMDNMTIQLARLPKLIGRVKKWCPTTRLVGFKLLVGAHKEERDTAAIKQFKAAQPDLVVVNDLGDIRKGKQILWVYSDYTQVTEVASNVRITEISADLAPTLVKMIQGGTP